MTDQIDPPGAPWSRPDPAPKGDPRPEPAPAYGWSGPDHPAGPSPAGPTQGGWGPTGAMPPQAPKPGIVPLRPMGLLEILDGAISAIRAHPVAMLGLSAVVMTISTLVQTITEYITLGDLQTELDSTSLQTMALDAVLDEVTALIYAMAITMLIALLAQIVLTGVLTMVVYRAVLGDRIPIGAAWREVRSRVPALLAVTVLIALAMLLAVVAVSVPGLVSIALGAPGVVLALVWLLTAAMIIVAIACVYVMLAVVGPAVVLERRGPLAACHRSRALVRGSFWRVFGILAVSGLLVFIIAAAIDLPFQVVSALVAGDDPFGVLPLTVSAVGAILGGTLTAPFAAGVVVLLFVDLRIRREGLDLELARTVGGLPGPAGGGPSGEGPSGQAGTPTAW